MKKCILCGSNAQGDKDADFEGEPYFECNVNVVVAQNAIYIAVRDSKRYDNYWHIDTVTAVEDEEKFTQDITMKLEKAAEDVLGG